MKALPDDVMKQILDELCPEKQQPGDIIVSMAAKSWELSRGVAQSRLDEFTEEGKFTKIWGKLVSKNMGWIYRPVVK